MYDFEALQVPIKEELQGRTLHFKHVPATVSICSNIPGHTQPLHLRSYDNLQQLVDDFVIELLKIQATRARLMTAKHQPLIDALNERRMEVERRLGEEKAVVDESGSEGEEREEDEGDKEEVRSIGVKRKRKMSKKQVSKRSFLDDEAELTGSDEGDEEYDDDDGSDLESMIDDSSDVEENNASFYRDVDRNRSDDNSQQAGPSTAPQQPTSLTPEQEQVERQRLKKIKAFLSKLNTYIEQFTILGFNSQKYDIPLIRSYL